MAVHIRTSREVKGRAYAERYPERAADLWVVASFGGKKTRDYFGPPTEENQRKAQEWADDLAAAHRMHMSAKLTGWTFAMASDEYLRSGLAAHELAETTRDDRRHHLGKKSMLRRELGARALAGITPEALMDLWVRLVVDGGRSAATGRQYLASIAAVYTYATQRGEFSGPSPVDAVRAMLRRQGRTKAARAAREATHAEPVEPLADLEAILATAARWRVLGAPRGRKPSDREKILAGDVPVVAYLLYDAGLRLSEALGGLRWGHVWFGRDASDASRCLRIEEGLARGKHRGRPKSGRVRRVALSLRLRSLLRERWLELGKPGSEVHVVVRRDPKKFRGQLARVCETAWVPRIRPKQLRDSFGSYLLTAGVQLGYIADQLGHADAEVTARHYARYVESDAYRAPVAVAPGEVPADLLARLSEAWGDLGTTRTPTGTTETA